MRPPRGLTAPEAEVWARLAASVVPFAGRSIPEPPAALPTASSAPPVPTVAKAQARSARHVNPPQPGIHPPRAAGPGPGLDSHWERKLRAGTLSPDFTLDLHEHTLDAAYQRLLGGLDIARETGARVVLVIAGRERPTHSADRGDRRGAIRAKLLDWLAASRHAPAIAAIRKAHRRHGGEGALYVVLRKVR